MNGNVLTKPKREPTAEYEAIANQLLADMKRLDELMQKERAEIEYFKAFSTGIISFASLQIAYGSWVETFTGIN